jgi:hypothetical protein
MKSNSHALGMKVTIVIACDRFDLLFEKTKDDVRTLLASLSGFSSLNARRRQSSPSLSYYSIILMYAVLVITQPTD